MYIYIYQNIKTLSKSKSVQHTSPKRATHAVPHLHIRKNMINDDNHDISRAHNFNTECVFIGSHSYVTPLFTVALPVGWPDWQIPSCARHEVSVEMNQQHWKRVKSDWDPDCMIAQHKPVSNTVLFTCIWLHSPDSNGLYYSSGPS